MCKTFSNSKYKRATFLPLLLVIAFLLGCQKDKTNQPSPSYYYEAEISGTKWTANYGLEATLLSSGSSIYISGRNKKTDEWTDVGLHIPMIDLINPNKSYPLGLPNGTGGIGIYSANSNYSSSKEYTTGYPIGGTVTITSFNDTFIEGTFSFKAKNNSNNSIIDVANGKFKVPVRKISSTQ